MPKLYISYNEGDESHHKEFKFKIPKKWLKEPNRKVLDLFVSSYNDKMIDIHSLPDDFNGLYIENSTTQMVLSLDENIEYGFNHRDIVYVKLGQSPESSIPILSYNSNSNLNETKEVKKSKEEMEAEGYIKCRNYGCGIWYKEEENNDDSCECHSGPPIFHDRGKGWTCCQKDNLVYDWEDFNLIAKCTRSSHSNIEPSQRFAISPTLANANRAEEKKENNNQNQPKSIEDYLDSNPNLVTAAGAQKKRMQEQKNTRSEDGTRGKCIRHGCNQEFLWSENNETACQYHSKAPIFHEVKKFWGCCPDKVKYDFDEFRAVEGCCIGYHDDGGGIHESQQK